MPRRKTLHRSALLAIMALGACGGTATSGAPDPTSAGLECDAAVVFVTADAAAPIADASPANAVVVDAAPAVSDEDASLVGAADADLPEPPHDDAGSGICPEPPLLTASSTPLAPMLYVGVALGDEHTCLMVAGRVWCWGKNQSGELGDGTQIARARPTRVVGLTRAVQIASGPAFDVGCFGTRGSHTCAVLDDSTVTCWGSNVTGATDLIVQTYEPTPVRGLENVKKLAVAGYSNCALHYDGTTSCFGVHPTPGPSLDAGLTDISAGYGVTGVRKDGTVWSWTSMTSRSTTEVSLPVVVPELKAVRYVVSGWGHHCALRSDGTVWCWGANRWGELGDGTTTDRSSPVKVLGVEKAAWIAAGGRETCAVFAGGTAKCWGDNTYGQLGTGTIGGMATVAVDLPLDQVSDIRGGMWHICARRWDQSVWCWGRNATGQVGDGTLVDRASPVKVYP